MPSRDIRIIMRDSVSLAATLYLPDHTATSGKPSPCLLEALPYRKDDVTFSYTPEYERLSGEFGYAVCRLDLRGTGSSEGLATDEYPVSEQDDLVEVIAWLAAQDWCDGNVGMYGTSYSGFNSIQVAMRRPPALKAVVPIYATDDRYTDDVHYMGGVRRLLDIVDYPTYMIAMNALPPVPEVYGDGWRDEWLRRVDATPWLLRWDAEQTDGPYWRHGSLRPDYQAITTPTMIIAGWADGYRNNTFRTYRAMTQAGTPTRLLIGPWSHQGGATARPGPHVDVCREMARWFDRWLRHDDGAVSTGIVYFARHFTEPAPDQPVLNGQWQTEPHWPSPRIEDHPRALGGGSKTHAPIAGTGTAAWNSCAGALPWGQPTDQRYDDAASLTWQWPAGNLEILGHARLSLAVRADQAIATVSAKLTDVAPDGTSTLITRALQSLTGDTSRVEIAFEATSWTFAEGHELRLSITGMDWPNTVAAPRPFIMTVDGDASTLTLPTAIAAPVLATDLCTVESPEPDPTDADGVTWRVSDDVLARTTACFSGYGSTYATRFGECADEYRAEVVIDRRTWRQTANADASFALKTDRLDARATSHVTWTADEAAVTLEIELEVFDGADQIAKRSWRQIVKRALA